MKSETLVHQSLLQQLQLSSHSSLKMTSAISSKFSEMDFETSYDEAKDMDFSPKHERFVFILFLYFLVCSC